MIRIVGLDLTVRYQKVSRKFAMTSKVAGTKSLDDKFRWCQERHAIPSFLIVTSIHSLSNQLIKYWWFQESFLRSPYSNTLLWKVLLTPFDLTFHSNTRHEICINFSLFTSCHSNGVRSSNREPCKYWMGGFQKETSQIITSTCIWTISEFVDRKIHLSVKQVIESQLGRKQLKISTWNVKEESQTPQEILQWGIPRFISFFLLILALPSLNHLEIQVFNYMDDKQV